MAGAPPVTRLRRPRDAEHAARAGTRRQGAGRVGRDRDTQDRPARGGSGITGQTLGDLGEDGLVAAVVARFGSPPAWLTVPAGDDAAVFQAAGPSVVSTDLLVEGEDFRRDWSSGFDVGIKAAAQNLADVAAMGARPLALLVGLAAPAALPVEWATGLADGLAAETARAGAAVVGGDVSAASQVMISGTALGVLDGVRPVLRSGARPGDLVAVAGVLGPSAAGLALLSAGRRPFDPDLVGAHLRPSPPYPAGQLAARAGATAMIDISDGLLRDVDRVARASGALIDLDPAALIPQEKLRRAADLLGLDPTVWVLTGGEDHALVACFPPGQPLPEPFRPIGSVLAGRDDQQGLGGGRRGQPDGLAVSVGGRAWNAEAGWRHFRSGDRRV